MGCIKLNLATSEIMSIVKFKANSIVMITGGNNIGRIGILQSLEKHPGSFDIAHIKDSNQNAFATRVGNIFVIGDGKSPAISLPKGEGLRVSLIAERDARFDDEEEEAGEETD